MFGSIFYEGEGRGGEGILSNFYFPPNWEDLEGRGGELF
jgi:hypothetical protein